MECDIERAVPANRGAFRTEQEQGNVCAQKCRHRGAAFRAGRAGRCLEGILEVFDKNGSRVTANLTAITAALYLQTNHFDPDAEEISREVYLTPLESGAYKVHYMVDIAGTWTLALVLQTGEHVAGSPFDVDIAPAEPSPYTTTLKEVPQVGYESHQREFIVQLVDGFGNNLRAGGVQLTANCLGEGRVVALNDCRDGTYRIICDSGAPGGLSKLSVALMGKDVLNSPWTLTTPPAADQPEATPDAFTIALERCRSCANKQNELDATYAKLEGSLVKEQREAAKSYHSTRLQIVHTLPVKFTIDEPDESLETKRADLIARHERLSQEIEVLANKVRQAEDSRRQIIDDLVARYQTSTKLHNDALNAYNAVCREIAKRTEENRERPQLIDAIKRGDNDAVHKIREQQTVQNAVANFYGAARRPEGAGKRVQLISRQYMSDEIAASTISVTPDRPNTPAFWMMEGRFKPPSKK